VQISPKIAAKSPRRASKFKSVGLMRQIQRVTNLRRQAPLPIRKNRHIKSRMGGLKLKPFGAKRQAL